MKKITFEEIAERVEQALIEINIVASEALRQKMLQVLTDEEEKVAQEMVSQVLENYVVAEENRLPLCQDTGMVQAEVKIGHAVRIEGGSLKEAIAEGVRRAYQRAYFRKSIIADPFFGVNTRDNTPPVYFFDLAEGEGLEINLLVKGGGCDNISSLGVLNPGSSVEDLERFVLRELDRKAAQACPPLVVGIGVGGNAAYAMYLASRALSRPLGSKNPDPRYAQIEERMKEKINLLGIGPQGVGGKNTCLEVRIEVYPCHIASFPVGLVASCHVFRQKTLRW